MLILPSQDLSPGAGWPRHLLLVHRYEKLVGLCLLAWSVRGRAKVETVASHPLMTTGLWEKEGMGAGEAAVRARKSPAPRQTLGK